MYFPDQDETVYYFGKFLAERLNPVLSPDEFYTAAELALCDLLRGVNGFTNQQIKSKLVGYPLIIYGLLRMMIPDIACEVCPRDFAQDVKERHEAVNAQIRKNIMAKCKINEQLTL
ncbi:MAG: hypothetical protein QW727_01655 [Candidatus Pacearchaeota archaeon]